MEESIDYTIGSGNVFADLGLPDPEIRLAKAQLAYIINNLLEKRSLTQTQAAELLEIDQPKISALSKGKLAGFSFERLFRFLNILDQNIIITVTPKKRSEVIGQLIVIDQGQKNTAVKKQKKLKVKAMKRRPSFEDFKERALNNEEVKAEYDLLEAEFTALKKSIVERKQARLDAIDQSSE